MMPALLNYLVKVSISLAVLYLFYFIVLRKMTRYNWNRAFLLACCLLSFFIPLIDVSAWADLHHVDTVRFVYQLPALLSNEHQQIANSTPSTTNYQDILFYIFLAGGLFMLIRLLMQFISLYRLRSKATLISSAPVKIYHLHEEILPFSFNKDIFINPDQHNEEELQEILNHELVHIRQRHTIDVLIAEIICVLNWFNPFAWLIKRAIKENLEFIADEQVLHSGADKKQYQYHLLRVMGYVPSVIVNHFNLPALKKRIVMMNMPQTGRIHLLKFLFIIPLAGILLLAFRSADSHKNNLAKDNKSVNSSEESFQLNTLTYYIKNHEVATLIKGAQDQSLLKPGKLLSLSLLQNESNRLKNLLLTHGYAPVSDQTITFLMDSSLANKSFSIRILVNIPESTSSIHGKNKMDPSEVSDALLNQNFMEHAEVIKASSSTCVLTNESDLAMDGRKAQTHSSASKDLNLLKK